MSDIQEFARNFFDPARPSTGIGQGSIGGKAQGLMFIRDVLATGLPSDLQSNLKIAIPAFTVIRTDVFDAFLEQNNLLSFALGNTPDDVIAHEFQKADLPVEVLGDLRSLADQVRTPLAIRSSSLLEDALHQPFAGVYMTKMIPNSHLDPNERFRKLIEAIKLIYASTFFHAAKDAVRAAGKNPGDEKMAVLIQEIVGTRLGERFYPHVSGVARSYHFYAMGRSRPEHGVASLALGLGKTIVDGDKCWTYSPAFPAIAPPMTSAQLLEETQTKFWAVNFGKPPEYDPIRETEYLVNPDLSTAEEDDTLPLLVSTYDAQSDRLSAGLRTNGARVLNFAGLLRSREIPFSDVLRKLLHVCQEAFGMPVEIEFAMTLNPNRIGFLQVRPMLVSADKILIEDGEMNADDVLVASTNVLGNGVNQEIRDVVYIKPDKYDPRFSMAMGAEVESMNRKLLDENRHYALVGFGRWGSADPWLGIPVNWGQISGARIIVEATPPDRVVELSQGSHFFHNLIGFQVSYFSVPADARGVRWEKLENQQIVEETDFVRHVRFNQPLLVKVDGTNRRGVIKVGSDQVN